ncbi:hypothetical protein Sru01_33210 [Sphaerisporangium rufum]|uniref:WXG100 family type VII secretion target n=1 Tax=Sphaerisporangium rufum TaxID=1381558 RepID=A0A919R265_9ACTN|nr:hypothetical protein [Sphaerisporangium rufum]GII78339.1 hypothetical protein Sru01_33210 [Sphaerisporangium rufum]
MSYESGPWLYAGGYAGASFFAITVNPVLGMAILGAIASITSRPDHMHEAGEKWQAIANEIDGVTADFAKLTREFPLSNWTAEDKQALDATLEALKQNTAEGRNLHTDAAGTMHGLAKLSYVGAVVSASIGGVLGALAVAALVPYTRPAAQAAGVTIGQAVQRVMLTIVKRKVVAAGAAAAVLGLVYTWNQSKQGELTGPGTQVKTAATGLQQVGLQLSNLPATGAAAPPVTSDPGGTANPAGGATPTPGATPAPGTTPTPGSTPAPGTTPSPGLGPGSSPSPTPAAEA